MERENTRKNRVVQNGSPGAGADKLYPIYKNTETQPRSESVNDLPMYSLALSTGKPGSSDLQTLSSEHHPCRHQLLGRRRRLRSGLEGLRRTEHLVRRAREQPAEEEDTSGGDAATERQSIREPRPGTTEDCLARRRQDLTAKWPVLSRD